LQQLAEAVVDAAMAERMVEILKALGLISCTWVWEDSFVGTVTAPRAAKGVPVDALRRTALAAGGF
jgi:hypothetical protein